MTSELRPEALVAHEVCEEMEEYGPTFAERVIKADREAVRAEQAAEIERLKSHLEDAKEIIQKQIKQAAELAKFKALAETLAGYVNHKPKCRFDLIAGIQKECDCGLSEALRQYKEARDD